MAIDVFRWLLQFKGFPLEQATRELQRIQSMPVAEFLDWQQKRAWMMVRHHYANNQLYRKKVGKFLPERWEDLPVLTKKDLQHPLEKVITKGTKIRDSYIGSTSGSSGTPFFFAKDKFTHAMTWSVIRDRYRMYGIMPGDRQARFYGIPKEFIPYWKERIKDFGMNRLRFSVFDLSDKAMAKFFHTIEKQEFDYLYGYTNSMVLFARYLIKKNIVLKNFCPSLKLCISTSELCTTEDHRLLENGFGVKHVREYGASETCLMAFDAPDNTWRLTEETLFTEVAGATGERLTSGDSGDVLCTSLFNTAVPIIRYRIGDMAVLRDRAQGQIYRSVDSLVGRTNDMVLLPGGKVAAGLTFYYISRSILETSGVLKEFIIRQTEPDHFIFDIVSERDLTEEEISKIKDKITNYLQPGLRLTINRVAEIRRPASGKLKHFYSELKGN